MNWEDISGELENLTAEQRVSIRKLRPNRLILVSKAGNLVQMADNSPRL